MNGSFSPEQIRLPKQSTPARQKQNLPRHKPGELFLKGPIPWKWLCVAAQQSGKATHVALTLWFLAGIKNDPKVELSQKVLRGMGVQRHSAYRGLKELERAKLVRVERRAGRLPTVIILDINVSDDDAS